MTPEPIPRPRLEAACRRFNRQIAATIINAMSELDFSFAQIAARIDVSESWVRCIVTMLMDGNGGTITLDNISDIFCAMGCRPEIRLTRLDPEPPAPIKDPAPCP